MLRIIGDVHGKTKEYVEIAKQAEYSLQVGDMAFDYSLLDELDWHNHRFFGGNHDNYDRINFCPHNLGDYGVRELGGIKFFFVRGSISIDCLSRVRDWILSNNKSWWYEEELDKEQLAQAIDLYEEVRPDVVITHDCPTIVKDRISSPGIMKHFGWPDGHSCFTQQALNIMHQAHEPKLWFFGHWHRNWTGKVGRTRFFCIDELDYIDLNDKMEVSRDG